MKKIIIGIIAIMIIIAGVVGYFFLYAEDNPFIPTEYWEWEISEETKDFEYGSDGYTNVDITQEMIDCVGSDPVDVFASLNTGTIILYVDDGILCRYEIGEDSPGHNPITVVVPGVYNIKIIENVEQVLRIKKC